ncbi:hypothetical protein SM124_03115 (plasmid) [Bacillus sp. 31A1R]|uniref:MFS transporter n=1 Tax=Robertmurraya mangrovi TaxID=3098077 RepID=A0ABU5IUC1_9BACI|nr:hypothetical protein [Bacillus sp. 31A1R]MDZ5470735.1 hypothetical protein [Bacillus sp. 31A1R]
MSEKVLRSPIWSLMFIWLAGSIYLFLTIYEITELSNLAIGILSIFSLLVLIFTLVWFALIAKFNKKNPKRKISIFSIVPVEFREEDEGMQWLTNRACRKVYMFFYSALPLSFLLLFFLDDIKGLPVIIIIGLATGQYIIYWSEIRKANS